MYTSDGGSVPRLQGLKYCYKVAKSLIFQKKVLKISHNSKILNHLEDKLTTKLKLDKIFKFVKMNFNLLRSTS